MGWTNLVEDWQRTIMDEKPAVIDESEVGRDLAATPGEVVYRNRLIGLHSTDPPRAR